MVSLTKIKILQYANSVVVQLSLVADRSINCDGTYDSRKLFVCTV